MDTHTDEEYQGLQEMLDINRELLQFHRKRLTGMGFTEIQIEARMAPLVARYEKLQQEMARLAHLVLSAPGYHRQ